LVKEGPSGAGFYFDIIASIGRIAASFADTFDLARFDLTKLNQCFNELNNNHVVWVDEIRYNSSGTAGLWIALKYDSYNALCTQIPISCIEHSGATLLSNCTTLDECLVNILNNNIDNYIMDYVPQSSVTEQYIIVPVKVGQISRPIVINKPLRLEVCGR
jgi:hypothetical protein